MPLRRLALALVLASGCASAVAPFAPRDAAQPLDARAPEDARTRADALAPDALAPDAVTSPAPDAAPPAPLASCIDPLDGDAGAPLVDARVVGTLPPAPGPGRCSRPIVRALALPDDSINFNYHHCTGTVVDGGTCEYIYSLHVDHAVELEVDSPNCAYYSTSIRRDCDDPHSGPTIDPTIDADACLGYHQRMLLAPGDWYLVETQEHTGVDPPGASIREIEPAPPNFACATPIELAPCTAIAPPDSHAGVPSCDLGSQDTVYHGLLTELLAYTATIPPGRTLVVTGASAYTRACGDSCEGGGARLVGASFCLTNATAAPIAPVFRLANSSSGTLATAVVDPAPYARCEAASRVAPGRYPGQNTAFGLPAPASCGIAEGRALYYQATVPPHTALRASISNVVGNVDLALLDGCGPTASCLVMTPDDVWMEAPGRFAFWLNDGPEARTVVIRVSSEDPSAGSAFDLAIDQTAQAELAPNATCDGATPLADGASLAGEDLARSYPVVTACSSQPRHLARELDYALVLPAGRRGVLTVSWDDPSAYVPVAVSDGCCGTVDGVMGTGSPGSATLSIPPAPSTRRLVGHVGSWLSGTARFAIAYRTESP